MENAKHTPGPWMVRYDAQFGNTITLPVSPLPSSGAVLAVIRRANRDAENADACLIAAAPEMYDALKAMHACHRAFSGTDAWGMLDDEARAAAESAIAKAEGRT